MLVCKDDVGLHKEKASFGLWATPVAIWPQVDSPDWDWAAI